LSGLMQSKCAAAEKVLAFSEKLSATIRWANASRTRQPGSVKRSPTSSAELTRKDRVHRPVSCAAGGGESEGAVGPCEDISTAHRLLVMDSVHPAVRTVQRKLNLFQNQQRAAGDVSIPDEQTGADLRLLHPAWRVRPEPARSVLLRRQAWGQITFHEASDLDAVLPAARGG